MCHCSLLSGHLGIKKTKFRVTRNFYWFELKEEIRIFIVSCENCSVNKPPAHKPKAHLGIMLFGAPWDCLATDYIGPLPITKRKNSLCANDFDPQNHIPQKINFMFDLSVNQENTRHYFVLMSGTRVMVLPNGPAPCNKKLVVIAEKLKPLIRDLMDHTNMLKMWIAFLIPKIEDGNNFGVSVQEETMGEARQVETEAASYLDQVSRYFISRAKLISKVAKYPHIDDYRQAVRELDEKEYVSLRLICCEVRNHYASLHDLVLKNIDKIKKPRSANADSLIY
ncbi:proteasome activator complex subunit 3-like [Saccostrea cucullata]|uniref:proteasome activator complex subunit 3-like n=1 Tax=Saccostrea cuccullata TaxID=36930 RepID=UPI002ED1B1C9